MTHQVPMSDRAVYLLNDIVDAAEDLAQWMDAQLETRHTLSPTEQCKLDDMVAIVAQVSELRREYLDMPRGIVIVRRFPGGQLVYWDGSDWTHSDREARIYASRAAARGTITRKTKQYVDQYSKGKPGLHHLNQWANAQPWEL